MGANLCATASLVATNTGKVPPMGGECTTPSAEEIPRARERVEDSSAGTCLSTWSQSRAKRLFDCFCVSVALPLLIPALLLVSTAVRATSRGPVFFPQMRVGRRGRPFRILKFRTLEGAGDSPPDCLQFTTLGRWLRHWKLDEFPQLFNVLAGHMSLVGPRPKMREYELEDPTCRPGITGAATLVFGREEALLERVPTLRSADGYRTVVMAAKHRLDVAYMAKATFLSDLKLIVNSVLRRWDTATLDAILGESGLQQPGSESFGDDGEFPPLQGPALPRMAGIAAADAATDL